jgi:hypothetical protein
MATVHIALCNVTANARIVTSTMPVPESVTAASDTMTSSGTSQQSSAVASRVGQFWSVTVAGGDVFVLFGADPTAVSDAGFLVLDGQTREFSVTAAGEKVAIKDA